MEAVRKWGEDRFTDVEVEWKRGKARIGGVKGDGDCERW